MPRRPFLYVKAGRKLGHLGRLKIGPFEGWDVAGFGVWRQRDRRREGRALRARSERVCWARVFRSEVESCPGALAGESNIEEAGAGSRN